MVVPPRRRPHLQDGPGSSSVLVVLAVRKTSLGRFAVYQQLIPLLWASAVVELT